MGCGEVGCGVWGVGCGVWGSGEMGKWGNGEAVSSPYHPKTLSPHLLTPADRLLITGDRGKKRRENGSFSVVSRQKLF
ncbi:hypothetical protein BH695_1278 [Microcystis aeruginosa PCC 7806SL]|uniref:Uncharacterized protein n=1 Tax=Microcystis aeruginosa PCC 7806SL TaxID=1903187 RepID=A0AB33BI86_MICA7|nr:hypothetical protein BH695_1278 [Microcystis aeruginosa PCC 7806SL]